VLLAVIGLSPQIVTETVYALAVEQHPPWVPTEIHVITTGKGAQNARLELLSDDPGWFHRLREDYGLPEISFDTGHIHVIKGPDGEPLDDILADTDNAAVADFITEHVRAITADPAASLHVSIAGGRKTMGFYVGYALSLFGRAQDRLSHVLVSPPFESLGGDDLHPQQRSEQHAMSAHPQSVCCARAVGIGPGDKEPHGSGMSKEVAARLRLKLASGFRPKKNSIIPRAFTFHTQLPAAIGLCNQTLKMQPIGSNNSMARNGGAAGAVKHGQEGALGGQGLRGHRVVERGYQWQHAGVIRASHDCKATLPDGGQEFVDGQYRSGLLHQPQSP
jgi:CRISPR-associated protein (TIGR02584 family)